MGHGHGPLRRTGSPGSAARASRVIAAGVIATLAASVSASLDPIERPRVMWAVRGVGRGTPAAANGRAYFLSGRHELVAVVIETGAELWRRPTGGRGPETVGSRVLIAQDVVVVGDYDLRAFDLETGVRRWSFTPEVGYAPGAYLGASAGDLVFAGSADGYLHAIDAGTGTGRWSRRVATAATVFAPAAGAGIVVVTYTEHLSPARGGVVAYSGIDGRELWRRRFLPWTTVNAATGGAGSPLVDDALVIAASQDGTIVGLSTQTGALRWTIPPLAARPDGRAPVEQDFRPLARTGSVLVAGSLTGQIVAHDLETRRERWRATPEAASVAFGLSADDGTVYVPFLSGLLVAIDAADGRERWRTGGPDDGYIWTPLFHGARLLAAGSGAGFVAFHR